MSDWTIVLWNEAQQIAEQVELPKDLWPQPKTTPQSHFNYLRQEGHGAEAALLIAAALPKLEMINWVASSLPHPDESDPDYAKRSLIRATLQRWIDDPDEENRRAIFELTHEADSEWPETLLALSIYFSGGSIAPENLESIQPDPMVCVHLGVGALQAASVSSAKKNPNFLDNALDLANKLATTGR